MSRKQIFGNLSHKPADQSRETETAASPEEQGQRRPSRLRPLIGSPDLTDPIDSTPVGALGQSLGELSERSKRADEIEKKLLSGQIIVELDTADVEPSFIPDRMVSDDEAFRGFVDSIRSEGQQVPILVRPHPDDSAKYQVAFGHRRLRAAVALARPVKAVVRSMSDQELVIAQGQENNERQDLSYIEKVRFAQRLEKQFPRDVIMSALAIYKSDLSNMLAVAAKIPGELVDAIGPAHGVGRRNWIALADTLASDKQQVKHALSVANRPEFELLKSKERFETVAKALKDGTLSSKDEVPVTHQGNEVGKISQTRQKVTLSVDRKVSPEFAEFVLNEVPRLYAEHRKSIG
ncbi:plasmid partitioning protein RepB [Aquamicrobium sp. NLF2-7]|uniref:plasmid partitioning protein RepB n=1 Tax=Aquamicrobium sp. NLF2-7 TaxID=2918753 RepID=UPI001EFAAA48|nr:plasmid partitioning protein RepB [Aquamicrobium sp. NLF2-7]MCG8274663.1 plasmid partitioning protein RepB [Aquamicrobium sp. NLF2-7]MCG8274735.1 plasmid partitioning protein RepB [Aquamicrobium sp. NLF2-7]